MSYQSFPSMYEDHDKKSKINWVNNSFIWFDIINRYYFNHKSCCFDGRN